MYCPNCGAKVPDDAKFCVECGKAIEKDTVIMRNSEKMFVRRKRRLSVKRMSVFVIMVILVGVVFGGILRSGIFGEKINMSDYCVVLSDGEYQLVPFTKKTKENHIKIADFKNASTDGNDMDYVDSNYAHITEDGEYLYFFSKLDEYGEYGNLYRAELRKLLEGNDQSAYVIKIASDVSTDDLVVREDHTIIYKKRDPNDNYSFRLYYFDGEKSDVVAKNICSSVTYENYIFYTYGEDDEESYTLYGQMLGSEEKRKIATHIESDFYVRDSEHILYFKTMSDERQSYDMMYIAGYSSEPIKLSADTYDGTWYYSFEETGKFYYTQMNEENAYLSDFVENPYMNADREAAEPDYYDEKYENDYTAYEEDYEKYEAAVERVDLMDYLSDLRCSSVAYSLYYYDISAGTPILISDQVDNYRVNCDMVYSNGYTAAAYFKRADNIKKISIDQVINEYDGTYADAESIIKDYICSNSADVNVLYCTANGEKEFGIDLQKIGLSDAFENDNTSYLMFAIYNNGRNIAFSSASISGEGWRMNDNDIYTASVNGEKISEIEGIMARDAVSIGAFGDQLGYYNTDNDFYMYINGGHVFVTENEYWAVHAVGYEDKSVLVWTDCYYTNGGTIVRITKSGETETVTNEADGIFALEDGKILYVTDKNLEMYNGKETYVLAIDVDYCWCADTKNVA